MELVVFRHLAWRLVCVAAYTPVQTGIVSPNVLALDAMATLSHPLVLQILECDSVCTVENVQRHVAGGMDAVVGKISVRAAGLDVDSILPRDSAKPSRQSIHIIYGQRNQLRHIRLQLLIHFCKADNTAVNVWSRLVCRPLKATPRNYGIEQVPHPQRQKR